MSRDLFKSGRLYSDSMNFPDNVGDNPYGPDPKRPCKKCGAWLRHKNRSEVCGPCTLNLTRPPSLSKTGANRINREDKRRKVYREDRQTATARVEICRRYNVSSEEVIDFGKRPRNDGLAFARCLLIYFLVKYLEKSVAEVTQVMRMGSPSTAENGYKRGKAIVALDARAREVIAEVKEIVLPDGLSPGF